MASTHSSPVRASVERRGHRAQLMKFTLYLVWAAGFALFATLIAYQGLANVAAAVAGAGWGLVIVIAWHTAPLLADTISWRALLPIPHRRPLRRLVYMRWICESINTLLPVAQVGGDLVRARLLHRAQVPGPMAGGSVVVDLFTTVAMQLLFALMGVGFLIARGGADDTVRALLFGIGAFSVLAFAFYLAQRAGLFGSIARTVERIAGGRDWFQVAGSAARLDRSVTRLYRRRGPLARACGWRLAAWSLGAGEVWLALHFLGHPVALHDAFMLEALGNAVRAAAFAVPGALGVQEAGFILLGSLIGIGSETAIALSLVKRVRELALGLPGLLVWQVAEGHGLWRRSAGLSGG